MATFNDLNNGFGIVTVMNARIVPLADGSEYSGTLTAADFDTTKAIYLDTLKICNLTPEGPTKTITGGQYANPIIKYGKKIRGEITDALGRFDVLEKVMGALLEKTTGESATYTRVSIGDKFPGAFAMQGETFFIDRKTGEKVPVYIFVPQFLPDALLTLTQDAEGDATVFDLNGDVCLTSVKDGEAGSEVTRDIFYDISATPFLTFAA